MRFFSNFVASPARDDNHKCSHPLTGDANAEKIARKKSQELKLSRQNHTDSWPCNARPSICYSCSDPRALATRLNLTKTMAPAKNRSCSRSWQWNGTRIRERHLSLSLLNSANLVTYAILVDRHFDFLTIFLVVTGKFFVTFGCCTAEIRHMNSN